MWQGLGSQHVERGGRPGLLSQKTKQDHPKGKTARPSSENEMKYYWIFSVERVAENHVTPAVKLMCFISLYFWRASSDISLMVTMNGNNECHLGNPSVTHTWISWLWSGMLYGWIRDNGDHLKAVPWGLKVLWHYLPGLLIVSVSCLHTNF